MVHSMLLEQIIKQADTIRIENSEENLTATHIAIAFHRFLKNRYAGFSITDSASLPVDFEEERLRYIYSEKVDYSSAIKFIPIKNKKTGITEDKFDFSCCEKVAEQRGATVLSSDIVFLFALKQVHRSFPSTVRTVLTDESILSILADTDNNVYDYVIDSIATVVKALNEKAAKAAAIRDWKPAPKFAEPQELASMFYEKIEKSVSEKTITLTLPRFFGRTDLRITIHEIDDVYYIHDNGCAIRHLSKNIKDKKARSRAIKKVCHPCWIDGTKITGLFMSAHQFVHYLKMLIFVAHADLYYTKVEKQLYCEETEHLYLPSENGCEINTDNLTNILKKAVSFEYSEQDGLYCWVDTIYALFSTRPAFLISTLPNKKIVISDKGKGNTEGEIFESFYWNNDCLLPYRKFVSKIAERFGADFDGKDVYLHDKQKSFVSAVFRFFNLAVLLSEFGHDIKLPKIRQKV